MNVENIKVRIITRPSPPDKNSWEMWNVSPIWIARRQIVEDVRIGKDSITQIACEDS